MATGHRGDVLKGFRTLFQGGAIAGLSDAELLERSADRGGPAAEVAFAALVERHGPMVLRVCRKALGDPHAAHDAFQSTFLVLARKADAIRDKRAVASWLHGVALRVSAAGRAAEARRRRHERRWSLGATAQVVPEPPDDLGAVLHEEVDRLPHRYRDAVVLCYFEGRSCEEAAGHLRVPVGTIKSRLSWARERLRERLARRGLGPAAGAVAAMLAAESAQAALRLPSAWVEAAAGGGGEVRGGGAPGVVSGSAHALANGVIQAMMMTKIKIAGGNPRRPGRRRGCADGPRAGRQPPGGPRARPAGLDGGEARPPDLRPGEAGRSESGSDVDDLGGWTLRQQNRDDPALQSQ